MGNKNYTWVGLIISIFMFGVSFLISRYIQFKEILFVGAFMIIVLIISIYVIISKINEFNKFIFEQEKLNNKNEERFKIYDRLNKLEAGIEYLQRKR